MKTKTSLNNGLTFIVVATLLASSSSTNSQRRGSFCQALLQNLPIRRSGGTTTRNDTPDAGTAAEKRRHISKSIVPTTISLKGGYDATIGPNPSNPIQFFTTESGMCPYAARTLIVLNELELDHETIEIRMSNGVKPDWYLKINPKGKVPALRVPYHNNQVVYESAICDEYLCDLYDESSSSSSSLMPDDPMQKAKIRMLNDQCDTILNPAFFTYLMNKDNAKDEELKQKLEEVLTLYENILSADESDDKDEEGPYMNGKDFTLADVHILPFFLRLTVSLRHYKNYHISKENFPNLVAWFELCSERSSVKSAAKSDEEIIELYRKFVDSNYAFGGLNKNTK